MKLDPAVLELLALSQSRTHVASAGGSGCSSASTAKITTTLDDSTEREFFMKTGVGEDAEVMFRGMLLLLKRRVVFKEPSLILDGLSFAVVRGLLTDKSR